MSKKALVEALEGSVQAALLEFLPDSAELSAVQAVRASVAMRLAAGIDEGGDLATAAHSKEFRAVLSELQEDLQGVDDAESDFWSAMSADMGNGKD